MCGMNGWFWIILLLFFRNGNYGGYGESPLVSDEFIKRDIFNTNQNVSTTSCQTQRDVLDTQKEILENRYNTSLGLANVQKDILLGNQNLQSQMAQCCCDLRTAIHAEGEATRGLIQANTIQDLRDRLSASQRETDTANLALQNNAQTNTILTTLGRYVTNPYVPYNYGCGCNCGCANF